MDDADFTALFGAPPSWQASAPGRVNLIGEHTDYQGGLVLPLAIPVRLTVALRLRPDGVVRVATRAFADEPPRTFRLGEERGGQGWLDYVQGVTASLRDAGHGLRGFDALLTSEIPPGSGLASSAALLVALARALRDALALPLDDGEIARVAHRAETGLVGAPVGRMDHLASSLAVPGSALFLDARSLQWEHVPLPPAIEVAVVDSGIAHRHAAGGYRVRHAEAEAAARALGVRLLRELDAADLERVQRLPPPLDRRARHVLTENARVVAFVAAMRAGDAARMGTLLREGHASLRDDYEASVPEVDQLVACAEAEPGVLGARMTGGGFGGAVVILARSGSRPAPAVARRYAMATGRAARVLME
jgi:galactokinase